MSTSTYSVLCREHRASRWDNNPLSQGAYIPRPDLLDGVPNLPVGITEPGVDSWIDLIHASWALSRCGQKFKVQVWAGLVPSGGSEGGSYPCLSLRASGGCWWPLAYRRFIPVSAPGFTLLSPLCIFSLSLVRPPVIDLGPTLSQDDLL